MPQTAKHMAMTPPELDYARVLDTHGTTCHLAADTGRITANRAAGCLLAPEPGDLVLISVDGTGRTYVLSVLERPEQTPGTIDYPGDVTVRAGGDLRLDGHDNASLSAAGTVTLAGERGEAAFGSVSLLARIARLRCRSLSVVAKTVEQLAAHLTQRLTTAVRLVAENVEVQAQNARYLVEDTLTMHAKNARHIAEDVIKIDAGQVHLG